MAYPEQGIGGEGMGFSFVAADIFPVSNHCMRCLFLLLLFPLQSLAQKSIRHYDFVTRNQPGLYNGESALSPRGNFLLVTFNDFEKKAVYELVDIATAKLIATGPLPAIPQDIVWSDDEKMVAINYRKMNAECYEVKTGLRKLFSTKVEGLPAFSRNGQLFVSNFSPELFFFGNEYAYRYNLKGVLLDSADTNDFAFYTAAWYDLLRNRFVLAEDGGATLHGYTPKTKMLVNIVTGQQGGLMNRIAVDKDGSLYFYYSGDDIFIHDAGTGKRITQHKFNKISAASFTPDSKNILVFDDQQMALLNLQGKIVKTMKRPGFYSRVGYRSPGMEMIAMHPSGFDVFACKDYFLQKEEPIVNKPPVSTPVTTKPEPVKTTPVVKEKPWALPYTIREFITPLNKDSFYLYSTDRALRYFIRYEKGTGGLFSSLSFTYSQFFGFSKDQKYQMVNNYTIDMTDSTARLSTYSRSSSFDENPLMIGGQNYLGQISSTPGKTLSWPMNIFKQQFTLSAKLIDYTYKGSKAKCLLVTRDDPKNGVNETYYYQQGVGLIRIDSNGKMGFER